MTKSQTKQILFRIIQIAIVTVVAYILIAGGLETKKHLKQKQSVALLTAEVTSPPFPIAKTREVKPFTFLNLDAKGAIVYDLSTDKIIFSQNKDDIFPIASLTKLMTIYTAAQFLTPDSKIAIDKDDLELDSDSGLVAGEHWDFKNLTAFTLVSSSNAGANAIAKEAQKESQMNFISQMNETAQAIGLQNTSFRNATGLDVPEYQISGSYSTTQDIAKLYSYIFKNNPELLADTNKNSISLTSLENIKHSTTNTNWMVNKIPGLISSKTGTTRLAGGTLAVLFYPVESHPVAIVLLGGTPDGRFVDMQKLIKDTVRVLKP